MIERRDNWQDIRHLVAGCTRCRGLGGGILGSVRGHERILAVGEAPGRRGAGRTGLPFTGDASAANLHRILTTVGVSPRAIAFANAILCVPLDEAGRNRRPTVREQAHCRDHLQALIEVLDPAVVVAVGAVALYSLGCIQPHHLTLADAGRLVPWHDRRLLVVYHPSPRVTARRPFASQVRDWSILARLGSDDLHEQPENHGEQDDRH